MNYQSYDINVQEQPEEYWNAFEGLFWAIITNQRYPVLLRWTVNGWTDSFGHRFESPENIKGIAALEPPV